MGQILVYLLPTALLLAVLAGRGLARVYRFLKQPLVKIRRVQQGMISDGEVPPGESTTVRSHFNYHETVRVTGIANFQPLFTIEDVSVDGSSRLELGLPFDARLEIMVRARNTSGVPSRFMCAAIGSLPPVPFTPTLREGVRVWWRTWLEDRAEERGER